MDRARLSEAAAEAKPLAEADKLRTALLRRVGHDLRSPLASAKASVTSLRSDDVEWSESEREAELLETADESLDRLSRLVDNLLDLSRLQAGVTARLHPADGAGRGPARRAGELGDDSDKVTVDIPHTLPLVEADPALLERVIANLLANALRYSPPGRPPLITGSALGDTVEIRVIDRGPGIPREDRDRVFAPFQRLGDTDNTVGVGLGLALARGLAEAMHGTLQPEDTPGGGLTMVVAVPTATLRPADAPVPGARERSEVPQSEMSGGRNDSIDATPPARRVMRLRLPPFPRHSSRFAPYAPQSRPGGRMTRVLVIDDEPQIVRALQINLKARGYEVHLAGTGTSALKVAAQHPPELVILDLGLPDFDGVDVIRGLRGWTEAPILVLSGRTDSTDKVEALDAGADDYVTKPFGIDELLARMRAVLRRSNIAQDQPVVTVGGATVDLAAKRVTLETGEDIRLTPTEWHLLEVLIRHPGKLMSQTPAPDRGLGPRLRNRQRQPPLLHGPAPPQTRDRPSPPQTPPHRTRHGLPLRALIRT